MQGEVCHHPECVVLIIPTDHEVADNEVEPLRVAYLRKVQSESLKQPLEGLLVCFHKE